MVRVMDNQLTNLFFTNLFTILSFEKGVKLFEKRSLVSAGQEFGMGRDRILDLFNEWKAAERKISLAASREDNQELAFSLCAALLIDENLHVDSLNYFLNFSEKLGVSRTLLGQVFQARGRFTAEDSIAKRARIIAGAVRQRSLRSTGPACGAGRGIFIANQVTPEGLDELQRLLLACRLGVHAAIDGPPGVGKTKSVIEVAKILNRTLYTKACSSRTTESHIISYPVLTGQNGVSVTSHVNGPLCQAMEEPGVFYGDEFNLLKEDVQKRLNSAFDERRSIDRNDGVQVRAADGFWAAISYNPTQNLVSRDLEDSVADRFVHFHYRRWPADFKAYVAACTAAGADPLADRESSQYGIELEWRGVEGGASFFRGERDGASLKWFEFFTGKPAQSAPPFVYRVYDPAGATRASGDSRDLQNLAAQSFSPTELGRMIARFTETLHELSRTGKSPLLKKIGMGNLLENEDLDILSLHESSARIEIAAMKHYHELLSRGCNRYLAQSYAVRLVIDQACYGQYRDRRLRNSTAHALVMRVARAMRLLSDNNRFNTNFDVAALLKGQQGKS
jgi:hypothetical protein